MNNAQIIKKMLEELADCKKKLEKLQEDVYDLSLSLDIDRAYDGLYEAEQQLNKCLEAV